MKISRLIVLITLFVLSFVTVNGVAAEIFEIDNFEQLSTILRKSSKDDLIIFDVDEVLVYPENVVQLQVAANFWEDTMDKIENRLGKDKRNLLHAAMLAQSKWALTDNELPALIHELQANKIKILALTAFWVGKMGEIESVEAWRRDQLKNYGIDLSLNVLVEKPHFEIKNDFFAIKHPNTLPVYHEGILLTNRHPKGDVINAFLRQINFRPKGIIFVDDRISHIKDLENFCKLSNIPFIGIHDNRIFTKYNTFNEKIGKFQFDYLEKHRIWLSDADAMDQMGPKP